MLKISLLIISLLLFLSVLNAQNYRYTIYNTETSDLPQNQIMSLFQDSHNNIWIGTKFGVAKYNGESFKIYSPHTGAAAGDVESIFETSKGEILLCTVHGNITKIKGDSIITYPKLKGYARHSFYQVKDSLLVIAMSPGQVENNTLLMFFNGEYKIRKKKINYFMLSSYANDTIWTTI